MAEDDKVFFKVEGMVKRLGITGMGGPDAIVSSLEGMEGIQKIVYWADKEAFELRYIPRVTSLERIFEKIKAIGEERNRRHLRECRMRTIQDVVPCCRGTSPGFAPSIFGDGVTKPGDRL